MVRLSGQGVRMQDGLQNVDRNPHPQVPDTILITGGTGFVGANLVRHLAQRGHRVVAYDLASPPPLVEHFWAPVSDGIAFEAGSVTDLKRLREIASRHFPSAIIHAAAVTTVNPEAEAALASRVVEVNLMGTVQVLDLARETGVRRMLYVSSGGVYGDSDPQQVVREDSPLQLSDLYAIAKESGERICGRYAELFGLDVVIGRLGQPFGPMERETGFRTVLSPIFQMVRAAYRKQTIRLPRPDYPCDWTYTADLAEAIALLLEARRPRHLVYNLSNGQLRWLSEVAEHLSHLIPDAHFEWTESGANIDPRCDPRRGPMDITRLREDVGFEPAFTVEQGLEAALPWWQKIVEAGSGA